MRNELLEDATAFVEGDTNTIDRETVEGLLCFIKIAIQVGELNFKSPDSIRPMTNGSAQIFYLLEDATKEITNAQR